MPARELFVPRGFDVDAGEYRAPLLTRHTYVGGDRSLQREKRRVRVQHVPGQRAEEVRPNVRYEGAALVRGAAEVLDKRRRQRDARRLRGDDHEAPRTAFDGRRVGATERRRRQEEHELGQRTRHVGVGDRAAYELQDQVARAPQPLARDAVKATEPLALRQRGGFDPRQGRKRRVRRGGTQRARGDGHLRLARHVEAEVALHAHARPCHGAPVSEKRVAQQQAGGRAQELRGVVVGEDGVGAEAHEHLGRHPGHVLRSGRLGHRRQRLQLVDMLVQVLEHPSHVRRRVRRQVDRLRGERRRNHAHRGQPFATVVAHVRERVGVVDARGVAAHGHRGSSGQAALARRALRRLAEAHDQRAETPEKHLARRRAEQLPQPGMPLEGDLMGLRGEGDRTRGERLVRRRRTRWRGDDCRHRRAYGVHRMCVSRRGGLPGGRLLGAAAPARLHAACTELFEARSPPSPEDRKTPPKKNKEKRNTINNVSRRRSFKSSPSPLFA